MTPGAGTAHVVGRVACRRMRAGRWLIVVLWRTFAAFRRSSGRHKWRPYVCGWLNAVLWRLVCGVARGGAIYDARCRNGTCGRSRCVSVDAGGAAVGLRFCGGWFAALRRSSGRHGWRPYVCGWLNAVLRRLSGRHKWRPYVCGWLNVVLWRSSGRHKWRPYVCGWLNVVSRRSSGRHKWRPYVCGWLNAVSRRLSGRHKWRPYVCGRLIVVLRVVVGGVTRGCRRKGMGMKKRSRTDVAVSVWLLVVAEARLERTTSRL